MTLLIFGEPKTWHSTLHILQTYRPDIVLYGFSALDLGSFQESDVTYTLREAKELYDSGIIDGVIQTHTENPYYFSILESLEIHHIFVIPHIVLCKISNGEDMSSTSIIYHYKEVLPELMQLEFHLADHCNLNCKGCSHFSNLVTKPCFANMNQFEKDLEQLSTFFSQIHTFFLLGGEPLLNPELGEYIKIYRKFFPYSQLVIVTNGLLLLTLKQELLSIIKENHVHISISEYACLDHEKITSFVNKHGLSAELRIGKNNFSKYLNTKGDSNPNEIFYQCIRHNCTFLGQGKIAACCQPLLIHYFNKYFDEHLSADSFINLYEENLDGWELLKRLITPMACCQYCTYDEAFDWALSRPPFSKDDWCVK